MDERSGRLVRRLSRSVRCCPLPLIARLCLKWASLEENCSPDATTVTNRFPLVPFGDNVQTRTYKTSRSADFWIFSSPTLLNTVSSSRFARLIHTIHINIDTETRSFLSIPSRFRGISYQSGVGAIILQHVLQTINSFPYALVSAPRNPEATLIRRIPKESPEPRETWVPRGRKNENKLSLREGRRPQHSSSRDAG